MVKQTGITGCCAASVYYDLGSVHGIPRKKNQEEFDRSLLDTHNPSSLNIAICNAYQTKEMEYLEAQGWKRIHRQGNLFVYAASRADFMNYKVLRNIKKQKEAEKVTLQWVFDLMGNSPFTTRHHGIVSNTFKIAVPHDYIGTRDVHKVFHSIKNRVAIRKKKKVNEAHGTAIAA